MMISILELITIIIIVVVLIYWICPTCGQCLTMKIRGLFTRESFDSIWEQDARGIAPYLLSTNRRDSEYQNCSGSSTNYKQGCVTCPQ